MKQVEVYSDITTNFVSHPRTQDLVLLRNDEAVKRSIKNLILTNPGEKFFRPYLGTGIGASLFENMMPDTEFLLKERIIEIIENYEPRAELIDVIVKAYPDNNAYAVTISFSVNNDPTPTQLQMVLTRVR
jgi:phage baseplate assembly protein W